MIPLTNLTLQYLSIRPQIDGAINRVLFSGRFILGEEVKSFEKEMADYTGFKYATGVASGSDALYLALSACGIKEGDEVITTPLTFIATVQAIEKCGATPVFVDIDPETYNINWLQIEDKITPGTRAILPVHLFGQPCNMLPILSIARKYNLYVIEDCAQSLGSKHFKGDVQCFSFFPTKTLGCYGDGGMVVSNFEIARRRSRLDELQAAILRVKLKHLDEWVKMRQVNAVLYNHLLTDKCIPPPLDVNCSYNYYTIWSEERDEVRQRLNSQGIESKVYYEKPIASLPHADWASSGVLSLPMYPELTREQIEWIASLI